MSCEFIFRTATYNLELPIHVPITSLWQGRTSIALPTVQHTRNRHEDTLQLDYGLFSAHGRDDIHELQSETTHLPKAESGSDCEAFGGALNEASSPFSPNMKIFCIKHGNVC